MTAAVVVWARKDVPGAGLGELLHWWRYSDGPGETSIPRYLEKHAERLRARYLEFIHDLGEYKVDGKAVVEHLDLGDGFSFWWMTWLAEKSPFKSPRIYDCLRLMALEEILCSGRPSRLVLHGADRELSLAVARLCGDLGVAFDWQPERNARRSWSFRNAYSALPHALQGLVSLRHLAMKWPLRKLARPNWFPGRRSVFLCSYFFHLDPVACASGRFYSRQWESLPNHLRDCGRQANWIHHFLRSPGGPSPRMALQWFSAFNRDAPAQGCHNFLETYLSWRVVGRALRTWLRLNVVALRLRGISSAFRPKGSSAWLWPLLCNDWGASLQGSAAMNNCLWVELFDAALRDIPRQGTGMYLWENQGWECAFLRAWRKYGHGTIIGVPHATVVFWHLNNFDDPRSLVTNRRGAKPLPGLLAVNGPMAKKAFVDAGCPPERLFEVEGLRFQYLEGYGYATSSRSTSDGTGSLEAPSVRPRKVLMLGDFTPKQTLKMLRCIEEALPLSGIEASLTLKSHPACRIGREEYPSLEFEQTARPLDEVLANCDLVFSSNTTSAGLEALLAGLPVIVFLDEETFNHSPLRGVAGVRFVGSAQELATALNSSAPVFPPLEFTDFFWLDKQLPRWSKLLSVDACDP